MLNHGSFGACPKVVLDRQRTYRDQIEAEPVRFFMREFAALLDASRERLAGLLGASSRDVVFVRNATSGVNSILRSLEFQPGDEILTTDHEYNACANAARFVADRSGVELVVVPLPVPVGSPDEVVERIMERVTPRTRLALLDHITSPTAIVVPIEELVARLDARGVDTLVDGAHAPGMLPLELEKMGVAYYTGNCHKWLCAPKGAGVLYVRRDRQEAIHPPVISHGFNYRRPGYSRFQDEFDWTGTDDPTPWLCVGDAIEFLASIEGGLDGVMRHNRQLILEAREIFCDRLGLPPVCPAGMLGSMLAVRLPDEAAMPEMDEAAAAGAIHPLQTALMDRFGIEAPLFHWPKPPHLMLRVAAQLYNSRAQYEYLASALPELVDGIGASGR
jgi:isopenicillin-N epimerase